MATGKDPSSANVANGRKANNWTRFPKERAAVVQCRAISPRSRLVLAAILDFVDELGQCWPSTETIAERSGLTQRRAPAKPGERVRFVAVDRAVKELRAAGVLSWQLVEPRTNLPNGARARTKIRVLRVDVERVRELTGTQIARRDQNDPFEGIKMIPSGPPLANAQGLEIPAESETPDPLNCDLSVKTLIELPPQEPHRPPREVVVVSASPEVERVVHAWLVRVWRWRFGDVPPLDEERRVREVVRARIEKDHVTEENLLDAIEGARVSPFCRGQVTQREVNGAGIFAGCLPLLIALGVKLRRNAQKREALAQAKPEPKPRPFDAKSAVRWAALVPKNVQDEVVADLESASEVSSEACGTRS